MEIQNIHLPMYYYYFCAYRNTVYVSVQGSERSTMLGKLLKFDTICK